MRPTKDSDTLFAYIVKIARDFSPDARGRRQAHFVAEDGELVSVRVTPMEEFILRAMLYGVEIALRTADRSGRDDRGSLSRRFDDR